MSTSDAPGPGVHRDVPHAEYLSWPHASNSQLGYLVPPSTPAHLKAYREKPPKDKKVWKEGRILHACILEIERYEREYRLATDCLGVTGKGEPCKKPPTVAVLDGDHHGGACHVHVAKFTVDEDAILVSEKDDAMARSARTRFAAHRMAGGFLKVPDAEYELSIVWDQVVDADGTVVRCKARLDWYSETFMGGLPMDLKGAREAREREFRKQAFYNGYLRQAVLYRMGLRSLGLPARTFAAVAQEKVPPFELMVYMLGDNATGPLPGPGEPAAHVAANVLGALRLWAWCQETGEYPGYAEEVHELTTDEWAWSAIDHQTDQMNEFLSGRAA